MNDRKIISISLDSLTKLRMESIKQILSAKYYDDVTNSAIIRIAIRRLHEELTGGENNESI